MEAKHLESLAIVGAVLAVIAVIAISLVVMGDMPIKSKSAGKTDSTGVPVSTLGGATAPPLTPSS